MQLKKRTAGVSPAVREQLGPSVGLAPTEGKTDSYKYLILLSSFSCILFSYKSDRDAPPSPMRVSERLAYVGY